MFELSYESLGNKELSSWKIALIPWDTETFGFRVSDLQTATSVNSNMTAALLRSTLDRYCRDNQVQLITTAISPDEKMTGFLLQESGFCFVDLAMTVKYEQAVLIPAGEPDGFSLSPLTRVRNLRLW